jgi:hypothetical protein
MVESVIPNLAWRLRLIRRKREGSIQQGKLADLPLAFLVSEEAAPADDLGDPPTAGKLCGGKARRPRCL